LLKNTGADHTDYEDLSNAYQKIVAIVDQVNERVRKVENVARLIQISAKLENTQVCLPAASATILMAIAAWRYNCIINRPLPVPPASNCSSLTSDWMTPLHLNWRIRITKS
jgi:anti-sigma factor ChrR (cupin superfamily)